MPEGYCDTKTPPARPMPGQNDVSGRSAIAAESAGGVTPTALLKVTRSMRQKTLHEFSSDGYSCPKCSSQVETMRGLASHWGQVHDGPTPDWIEYPEPSEEHKQNLSESLSGRELSEEHREKLSGQDYYQSEEYREKMSDALSGREVTDEHRQKISESMSGENNPLYGACGEDHPNYGVTWPEEVRERMGEGAKGNSRGGNMELQTVDETGHTVKSTWEATVDRLLHASETDFEYEPETFEFEDGRAYTPDFIAGGSVVVEVKGHVWNDWSIERAIRFMSEFPDYTYVVVGAELPCDRHLPWSQREDLTELI